MAVPVHIPLPPLRRKIRQSFFALIALYVLLGIFMLVSVFLASGITPKLIHVNYDSIAAAMQMQEAWHGLHNPELYPRTPSKTWVDQFEQSIQFEEGNITEPGEGETARHIRSLWTQYLKSPSPSLDIYNQMEKELHQLIAINEKGMFHLAESSTSLGRKVFLFSSIFFVLSLIVALFLADGLAIRLARPIKTIAEILRSNPSLSRKLKLPAANSLEIRILEKEIGDLWERLSKLQKLNVEELAAERERLQTVFASVEDAVLVLDARGQILQLSDGMLRILGLKSEDTIGHPWNDLSTLSPNYLKLRERLTPELQANNAMDLIIDGEKRTFAARYRAIGEKTYRQVGILYLLHDITEMRHRERLKTEFIGVLSHELKTPLQSLGTAAELLANRTQGMNEETRMLVETIHEDVSRIRAVANDFMQVSAFDLHSLKIKLEKMPLNQLLQDWLKPFRILARDKNVKIEFVHEGSGTIWAKVDSVKFPWAISNLLANAIRVSQPGSVVRVVISDRADLPYIEIQDEGPGIPEHVRPHIFEPYYQAPAAESGTPPGFLGLGLTIAKEVVEAHEGRLEYFPRRPHGSTFRISVPYVTGIG